MSYQEQADLYVNGANRDRWTIVMKEQALVFSETGTPAGKSLAQGVLLQNMQNLDAIAAAISVGPHWQELEDDAKLKQAVEEAWPNVAKAIYPEAV